MIAVQSCLCNSISSIDQCLSYCEYFQKSNVYEWANKPTMVLHGSMEGSSIDGVGKHTAHPETGAWAERWAAVQPQGPPNHGQPAQSMQIGVSEMDVISM